ncbi:nucleotidyltransferase domain-containing protein [Candidatus Woesearchaeota archaeon]|nr:nucleotidyltransferase domain-containing protein [Candidatus Woesearchaeota archaeon]
MEDNLKLAVKFTEKVKTFNEILQVILFGSVSRGEDTPASDIDLAIVHNSPDSSSLLKKISVIKPEKVQVTLVKLDDFPKETELVGALSGEGLLLYGKPIQFSIDKTKLQSYLLISYSLSKLSQTEKMKVKRALYGSISRFASGKKVYISEAKGLIKEPGISKINKGVLLIERKKATKVINLLKSMKVAYKEYPFWGY